MMKSAHVCCLMLGVGQSLGLLAPHDSRGGQQESEEGGCCGGAAPLWQHCLRWAATLINVVVLVAVLPFLLLAVHVLVFGALLHRLMGLVCSLADGLGNLSQGTRLAITLAIFELLDAINLDHLFPAWEVSVLPFLVPVL